jgi:hypothetical protein
MSALKERWARCQQPNCASILFFDSTRAHCIALAEKGELVGLCPTHGNQTIPWALQTEIADAIPEATVSRTFENLQPKRRAAGNRRCHDVREPRGASRPELT